MSSLRAYLSFFIVLVVAAVSCGCTRTPQQEAAKQPVSAAALASGAHLYGTYCADCHGVDGKGDGPAAPMLKAAPPDLTTLARNNRGTYPGGHVFQAVKWGGGVYRPRSGVMPVWASRLTQGGNNDDARLSAQIMELTNYVESLQAR